MSIINPSRTITTSHHLQIFTTSKEPIAAAAAASADSTVFPSDGDHDNNDPTTGVISDEEDEEDEEDETTTITTTMEITPTATIGGESEGESQENDITILQQLVSDGLCNKLSHQERCEIENEIHGVQSMGFLLLSEEEQATEGADDEGEQQEGYSTLVQNSLEEFANHLEYTLLLDDATATATVDSDLSSSSSASDRITFAYEICLQRKYTYVTQYDSQLKLMCLRADLWKNPQHSVVRFLNHLNLLQKYYGSDALQSSRLSLSSCLNNSATGTSTSTTTDHSSCDNKKKRKFPTKNKELSPEMSWLKQGGFQLLPSKDRSGRRVVIFQEQQYQQQQASASASASSSKIITQQQQQHARFKAMFYFFSTIARNDIDVQRDGLVLIISSSSGSDSSPRTAATSTSDNDDDDDDDVLISQSIKNHHHHQQQQQSLYNEFFQALPIRFSAIHYCYDQTIILSNNTNNNVIQSNNMFLLKGLVYCDDDSSLSSCSNNTSTTMSRQRIRFHDSNGNIAATNNEARNQLSTYGIPVHEIPATSTGTIKVKQHSLWIKMQLWFDKQNNNNMQNYNKHSRQNEFEQIFVEEQQEHYKSLSLLPFQSNHKNRSSNNERPTCTATATATTCTAAAAAAVIIECPNVNDVLFQQGGKFWNDNNKHQRGNLEFMDIIESKIINKYRQVGQSWKKKQILIDLINEYSANANANGLGSGRFLEDASQSSSILPAGTWIELPLDSPLLLQKIRSTLANHIRRLENNNKNNKKSKSKSKIKTINNNKRRRLSLSSSSSSSINGCTSIVSSSSSSSSGSSINTSNEKKQTVRRKFTTPQSKILVDAIIADDKRINKECDDIFGANFCFQLSN